MGRWIWGAIKAVLFLMALYALLLFSQWLTLSEPGGLGAKVVIVWAILAALMGGCARRSSVVDFPALVWLALGGAYAGWVLAQSWGWAGGAAVGLYWLPAALGWALAGWAPLAALSLRPKGKAKGAR